VKRLRERTGAPIVDVKNALAAHDYDAEAALDHLRASGLAAAAKKAHRASADGVVCATTARANGAWTCAIAEVNSETDFVARNETFRAVDFANKLAMHVVASAPAYLRGDCVPNDVYEREMAVYRSQTEGSGKPANIVEKILAGRMNKFYEEVCLENQKFVLDDSVTVGKAVKAEGGELIAFTRMKVGEGIDVEEKDFASEVA
ncbi:predicted protein, partial [Ostreococcus lucimarinus CCE9901]